MSGNFLFFWFQKCLFSRLGTWTRFFFIGFILRSSHSRGGHLFDVVHPPSSAQLPFLSPCSHENGSTMPLLPDLYDHLPAHLISTHAWTNIWFIFFFTSCCDFQTSSFVFHIKSPLFPEVEDPIKTCFSLWCNSAALVCVYLIY